MLDTVDFTANPAAPEFDGYGMLSVRYGKAAKGSPPRRRNVLTVMGWAAEVVAEWVEQVRGCYGPGQRTMLWPTERGGRVSGAYIGLRFDTFRDALGLPGEPRPHCLRHAYVTHLVEDGFDPFFVQQQVGHAWGSTTRGPGLSSDWWPRATTGSPPPARMAARTADPCGGGCPTASGSARAPWPGTTWPPTSRSPCTGDAGLGRGQRGPAGHHHRFLDEVRFDRATTRRFDRGAGDCCSIGVVTVFRSQLTTRIRRRESGTISTWQ
jgi:Phage integrase family